MGLSTSPGEILRLSMNTSIIVYDHVTINYPIEYINIQRGMIMFI